MIHLLAATVLIGVISTALLSTPLQHSRTRAELELGKALFFDKRLSANGTVSCATCHDPATAFASTDAVTVGVNNQKGTRNAPTLLNSALSKSYFWDGRAASLEEQVKQPLLSDSEMGMTTEAALVERITGITEYRRRFRRVFPREGITLDTIAKAIAAYERTLVSRNSPFDRFLAGDEKAMTDLQKQGWALFQGKAKCVDCHLHSTASSIFSDNEFHNTGIRAKDLSFETLAQRAEELLAQSKHAPPNFTVLTHDPQFSDLGRFLITLKPHDIGAFKTPTLRDVELTGPYMHDGSMRTLLDVVRFYNQGGSKNPRLDEKMTTLHLSDEEMSAVVEFLRALTSDEVLRLVQSSKPQKRNHVRSSPDQ